MSPELAARLRLLGDREKAELASTLERLGDRASDLDEIDIFTLLDAVVQPPPLPTHIPVHELMDVLDDAPYRSLKSLLACRAVRLPFYVAPVHVAAIPAPFMAKVNAALLAWYEKFKRHGWDPND